jgi:hypothetical protein
MYAIAHFFKQAGTVLPLFYLIIVSYMYPQTLRRVNKLECYARKWYSSLHAHITMYRGHSSGDCNTHLKF